MCTAFLTIGRHLPLLELKEVKLEIEKCPSVGLNRCPSVWSRWPQQQFTLMKSKFFRVTEVKTIVYLVKSMSCYRLQMAATVSCIFASGWSKPLGNFF